MAAFVLAAGPALAVCPGLDVLVEDSFDELQPVWGAESPELRTEDSLLMLSPASGTDVWRVNEAGVFDDVDMCVTLHTVSGVEDSESKGGAIFWYEDVNNFYVFELAPNGQAALWRRQRGRWLEQVPWAAADGANAGDGGSNELRITTNGDAVELFVNGTRFAELKDGAPPTIGQQIGVYASSPDSGRAIFGFDDLRVTRP